MDFLLLRRQRSNNLHGPSLKIYMSSFTKKQKIIIAISIIFLIIFMIAIEKYQYNKCVRINKEEWQRCIDGKLGNYDCSVFENAEELCSYGDDSDKTPYR